MDELPNLWIFEKNRLLILQALYECENHLCGIDFIDHLDIPKNLISYHLKLLREQGFVEETKVGRHKHYQLVPTKIEFVEKIFEVVGLKIKK